MGRFKGNDATRGLQGNVGDFYSYRQLHGKTVTARQVGKREKPATAAQEAVRERFLEATLYAKGVMAAPAQEAIYRAKAGNGKSVYNLAVSDYCVSPTVKRIDTSRYRGTINDSISVRAVDDFQVTGVQVAIYTMDNELVEQGAAVLDPSGIYWVYTAKEDHIALEGSTIKATAKDLPGNEGSLEVTL